MLSLQIHALDKTLFAGSAEYVIVPGKDGELSVHDNHMPLLTTLQKGMVRVKPDKDAALQSFEVQGGTLEVKPGGYVSLLVK